MPDPLKIATEALERIARDGFGSPAVIASEALASLQSPEPSRSGEELLPCPFCGGEASPAGRITYSEHHEAWWPDGSRVLEAFFVNCVKCTADNRGLIGHQTAADAVTAWNTRAPSPQLSQALAERDEARAAAEDVANRFKRQVREIGPALIAARDEAEARAQRLQAALEEIEQIDTKTVSRRVGDAWDPNGWEEITEIGPCAEIAGRALAHTQKEK